MTPKTADGPVQDPLTGEFLTWDETEAQKRRRSFKHYVRGARRSEIYERDGYRCHYCGRDLVPGIDHPMGATIDHIIPLSKGGNNSPDNLVTSCRKCNKRKGNNLHDR